MLSQPRPGRKHREHRGFDHRDLAQQFYRARATGHCGGQEIAVPLEMKTCPAGALEGVESEVLAVVGKADFTAIPQVQGFVADRLPMVAQKVQLRKALAIQDGAVRHRRARINKHVVGRHDRRVIKELSFQGMADTTAKVDVSRRQYKPCDDKPLDDACLEQGLEMEAMQSRVSI